MATKPLTWARIDDAMLAEYAECLRSEHPLSHYGLPAHLLAEVVALRAEKTKLLEACEAAETMMVEMDDRDELDGDADSDERDAFTSYRPILEQVRAAIAAAKGGVRS